MFIEDVYNHGHDNGDRAYEWSAENSYYWLIEERRLRYKFCVFKSFKFKKERPVIYIMLSRGFLKGVYLK